MIKISALEKSCKRGSLVCYSLQYLTLVSLYIDHLDALFDFLTLLWVKLDIRLKELLPALKTINETDLLHQDVIIVQEDFRLLKGCLRLVFSQSLLVF